MARSRSILWDPLRPARRARRAFYRNPLVKLLGVVLGCAWGLVRLAQWTWERYRPRPALHLSYAGEAAVDPRDADTFYSSRSYQRWSTDVLAAQRKQFGYNFCVLCFSREGPFHSDHIKPRSTHPELALDPSNGQCLCGDHNMGKGNRYQEDWRPRLELVQ